jgi:hypothetical protein
MPNDPKLSHGESEKTVDNQETVQTPVTLDKTKGRLDVGSSAVLGCNCKMPEIPLRKMYVCHPPFESI